MNHRPWLVPCEGKRCQHISRPLPGVCTGCQCYADLSRMFLPPGDWASPDWSGLAEGIECFVKGLDGVRSWFSVSEGAKEVCFWQCERQATDVPGHPNEVIEADEVPGVDGMLLRRWGGLSRGPKSTEQPRSINRDVWMVHGVHCGPRHLSGRCSGW